MTSPRLSICIEIRNVYGEEKAYPKCDKAEHFAAIAGTKTVTRATLGHVLGLGFEIAVLDRYGEVCRTFFGQVDSCKLPAVR